MKEYQGDIFGNWKPIEKVNKEIKFDKRFYSKLKLRTGMIKGVISKNGKNI